MPVRVKGKIKRTSDRAILFEMAEPDTGLDFSLSSESYWIPKSQIPFGYPVDYPDDIDVEIQITDWIAAQKHIVSNVDDVDLERYVVQESAGAEMQWNVVDTRNGAEYFCWCRHRQHANMIAAALNLTQGKV